jgi:hypothetical protein
MCGAKVSELSISSKLDICHQDVTQLQYADFFCGCDTALLGFGQLVVTGATYG